VADTSLAAAPPQKFLPLIGSPVTYALSII